MCSSKLWQVDAEMLGVVPGKGFGGTTVSARVAPCLYNGLLQKPKLNAIFTLCLFFFKWKFYLDFYQLMKTSTYVVILQKNEMVNFQK